MTTQVKLQVIDADAHVVETERTWDYLEPSEQKYRPMLYTSPNNNVSDYWLIDGEIGRPFFPSLSEQKIEQLSKNSGRAMGTPKEARDSMTCRCGSTTWTNWEWMCRSCTTPSGWKQSPPGPTLKLPCAALGTSGSPTSGSRAKAACAGLASCPT